MAFFWQNKLENLHYKIIDEFFEGKPEFEINKINIVASESI